MIKKRPREFYTEIIAMKHKMSRHAAWQTSSEFKVVNVGCSCVNTKYKSNKI